jgi:tetratricopeptide (TPR) repeat protein
MRRDQGRWEAAIESFSAAIQASPSYAEAHRELGVAQSKLFAKTKTPPDGIAALERAVQLKPDDFDALSSLGGALRRAGRLTESLLSYRRAVDVSLGHPYPLLNVMKLEAMVDGKPVTGAERELQLKRADRFRRGQAEHDPPFDAPWSFFDLAEIQLYLGRADEFTRILDEGLVCCSHRWQAETFRAALEGLAKSMTAKRTALPAGLEQGIARLKVAEPQLPA